MKKNESNLNLIHMVFAISLVVANCIGAKLFNTGLSLFGSPIVITCGAIVYPLTFLCTDVIGELWGKEKAKETVKFGFVCQIIATAVIMLARYLPAVDGQVQDAYVTILGQNYMFVIASLVAYWCSQSLDVYVFHKIRNRYITKHGTTKGGKWIWNNVATMSSQLIDSILYASIAFGVGFGWLGQPEMYGVLINMIIGQWLIKIILAALDTPIFYLLTKESK